jgi:hypothetical protein
MEGSTGVNHDGECRTPSTATQFRHTQFKICSGGCKAAIRSRSIQSVRTPVMMAGWNENCAGMKSLAGGVGRAVRELVMARVGAWQAGHFGQLPQSFDSECVSRQHAS